MFYTERFDRVSACIGLSHSATSVVEIMNEKANKANAKCHEIQEQLEILEQLYPHSYLVKKEWINMFREFCWAIKQSEYFCAVAGRLLDDSKEFIERAEKLREVCA